MIEIMDVLSGINKILDRVGLINTEIILSSQTSYTINLISETIPILDETSQVDLEEV